MDKGTRKIYFCRLNKEFSSKFAGGYPDWQIPEERQGTSVRMW